MDKLSTMLWFDSEAEEAANFYISIFKDSKINNISRYPEGGPAPAGKVMVVSFSLEGRNFLALNGGPVFKFNEAISIVIHCKDQQEIDYYWEKLTAAGGKESQCGWLKDKFGLSWQVVPEKMGQIMSGKGAPKAVAAMMKMGKLNIAELERAANS
jgi:predicted 3-demethylubiquinone-9 3-methyltransferase (glyoxalase superfamily)